MNEGSVRRVGGALSVLLGASYFLVGVIYFLLPTEQRPGNPADVSYPSIAQDPTLFLLLNWVFGLGALFALGAVPAISAAVRPRNPGLVAWTTNAALLGFAIAAVDGARIVALFPARAQAFATGDETMKIAISASIVQLDPQGWLVFGAVGLWALVVSVLALRSGALPGGAAYAGILLALLYWTYLAGSVLRAQLLAQIAVALGGIIAAPVFYVWTGLELWRRPEPAAAEVART